MRFRRTMVPVVVAVLCWELPCTASAEEPVPAPAALDEAVPDRPLPVPSTQPCAAPVGDARPQPPPRDTPPVPPPSFPLLHRPGKTEGLGDKGASTGPSATVWSVVWATALILALVVGGGYLVRRFMPGMAAGSGHAAVTVLARVQLTPRHWVSLVRCGRRVLILGLSGERITALSEITDGAEVVELLGQCEQSRPGSASSSFRGMFQQEAREMSDEVAEFDAESEQAPSTALSAVAKVRNELAALMEKVHGWKQA